jgi:extracellular elastinolytic metalloproteinase
MRNFLLLLTYVLPIALFGQNKVPFDIAMDHLKKQAIIWQIDPADYEGSMISSEATNQDITYLYLNQTYKGIPVRNAMAVIIIKNGAVVSDNQNYVQHIEKKINASTYKVGADVAIVNAAQELGITLKSRPVLTNRSNEGKWSFEMPELTKTPIQAELKYELVDGNLILVWNLSMDMKNSADYWDMNIDATTGIYISKHNLTIYCQHGDKPYANHNNCSHYESNILHQAESPEASPTSIAKYNVFALPAESPIHGTRKIVGDEQYNTGSPFGWHDTNGVEGPEYTITRGNNVYAYQDKNDDDRSDGPETDGGSNLNFDFPIDFSKDPRENADAAVTNLFYMNNMIHDLSYKWGFTEEFGNFQQKNYTGKGDGSDYVLAQAFDGITLHEAGQTDPAKINNANFSTPIDGFNGRMQMYLWTNTGGIVSIDEPENIKGFINEYGNASFGLPIPNKNEPPVSGSVAIAKSAGANGATGCSAIINGNEVKGKVAIIERGTCDFSNKVYNAQQAGAIAAIICNITGIDGGNGEEIVGMAAGLNAEKITIPSIFMKKSDCDKIKVELSKGVNVVMTFQERGNSGPKYFDGSLDNGIMAHEYGHGISTRLTGGRLNSSCLNNDEQMGEGWSDFFALILTHKPGDKGSDARGIGNYALGASVDGSGIRRYPYSTDMNINPQTYKDIRNTTAPHPVGEVWADILWDMYWKFIDNYGFDPDWNNEKSGNFLSARLVIEAMKIQPCNPNFVKGRDAILKADSLLFNGKNAKIIWESFARRGVGFYASAGNDRNQNVEDFNLLPTLIEKLKITKTATSSVDPGAEIDVHIHAINHIPSQQNNVIITDELPDGMSYVTGSANITPKIVGNELIFEIGTMEYKREIDITYKTKSSPSNKSIRLDLENFDGNFDWNTENTLGSEEWISSYDIFRSPDQSYSIFNGVEKGDASLISIPYEIKGKKPAMRFWHRYNTQNGNDGGFVEISADGGAFVRVPKEKFIRNPYNTSLAYATIAEPNVYAFSGNSGGDWDKTLKGSWIDTYIDLSDYAGKNVTFKFRFVCDDTEKAKGTFTGWFIDDFEILDMFKYNAQACIASENGTGAKACTESIETIVNPVETVSVNDTPLNKDILFKLEPNPADDYVSIQIVNPEDQNVVITISNISGQVLYNRSHHLSGASGQLTIHTDKIPSGMYLVKMMSNNKVYTEKLIVK